MVLGAGEIRLLLSTASRFSQAQTASTACSWSLPWVRCCSTQRSCSPDAPPPTASTSSSQQPTPTHRLPCSWPSYRRSQPFPPSHLTPPALQPSAAQLLTLRHHSPQPHAHVGKQLSLDPKEAAKFAALASEWWDPLGPFAPLHRFNPARCKFIRAAVCSARGIPRDQLRPLLGMRALDVGCGGGILAESLARLGAQVHAIDVTEENVLAAQQHSMLDPALSKQIRYECVAAEEVLARGDRYDLVLVSEVVEHVRRPDLFVQVAAQLMSGGGPAAAAGEGQAAELQEGEQAQGPAVGAPPLLIMSTLNRSVESFAVAIVGAEYVSGAVPRGTHDWSRFITPQELTLMAEQAGLELHMMAGIGWSLSGPMQLTEHTGVNYIASFQQK